MALTAKRIERRRLRRGTGLETLVDMVAVAVFILGACVALAMFFTFTLWGMLAACSQMLGGFLGWLLLRCLAEHLRLQKKIAGIEFEGQITGPNEEKIWSCGNCGQMLHKEDRCEACGAQIVPDDAT